MSAAAQGALIGGGFALAVTVANLIFNYVSRRSERTSENQEWYSRTLFEKRVKVSQEAYAWVMRFHRGIALAEPSNPDNEWTKALKQFCFDAREWYDNSAVFLYDSLPQRSEFVGLINAAAEHTVGRGQHFDLQLTKALEDASAEIRARLNVLLSGEGRDAS